MSEASKARCARCGRVKDPATQALSPGSLISNKSLWEERAGQWCPACQKAFLESMRGQIDKECGCIESQDGKPWEVTHYKHCVKKNRLKTTPMASLEHPMSGLYYTRKRRSDA